MRLLGYIYNYRGPVLALPLVLALFCSYKETETGWIVWPLGSLIFAAGLLVRIWAQQHLLFRLKEVQNRFTRTGPYGLVRNPIYIGNTLICVGLTVLSALLWLVPVTALWCAILYSLVVRVEEKRLLKLYGSLYADYLREVRRWMPRLHGKPLGIINNFLGPSMRVEIHNFLLPLPFIIKELILT